ALAERLGLAHSTIIMAIEIEGSRLRVKRELEGGYFQWIAMSLPALLTIQSGINQLRYATLKGIMAAKKKDLKVVEAQVPPPEQEQVRVRSLSLPDRVKKTRMITGTPDA